jgi:hypothetical protein
LRQRRQEVIPLLNHESALYQLVFRTFQMALELKSSKVVAADIYWVLVQDDPAITVKEDLRLFLTAIHSEYWEFAKEPEFKVNGSFTGITQLRSFKVILELWNVWRQGDLERVRQGLGDEFLGGLK